MAVFGLLTKIGARSERGAPYEVSDGVGRSPVLPNEDRQDARMERRSESFVASPPFGPPANPCLAARPNGAVPPKFRRASAVRSSFQSLFGRADERKAARDISSRALSSPRFPIFLWQAARMSGGGSKRPISCTIWASERPPGGSYFSARLDIRRSATRLSEFPILLRDSLPAASRWANRGLRRRVRRRPRSCPEVAWALGAARRTLACGPRVHPRSRSFPELAQPRLAVI